MKIIIAGCGKVGAELAQQLSQEKHAVTVIDTRDDRVEAACTQADIMGIAGNCAAVSVQREAQVPTADLLIATTGTDELNMLSCLIARKLGAKHTIARVRDPEYVSQLGFLGEELGLSLYVNPEYAAASEVFRLLRFPSAQKLDVFAGGRVEIVELTVPHAAGLAGLPLRELPRTLNARILICAVQRDGKAYIPDGSFTLREGDRISITGEPTEVEQAFRRMGLLRRKVREVLLVGGSRISYYLAEMLAEIGAKVTIVEKDPARCTALCELLPDAAIICGDGTDYELLGEAGLDSTDAVVMLTGSDEENIILALYAAADPERKVIVKVNSQNLVPLGEHAGLESIISPKHITANMILRYVRGMSNSLSSHVEALHSLCGGGAEALEFAVRQADRVLGIPLRELPLRKNLLLASLIRDDRALIPGGQDVIRAGDHVIVVTTEQGLDEITDILR